MIRSEKKLKELESILADNNIEAINTTIAALREEQPFEGAISMLTSYYNKTAENSVKKNIEGFMNDLKDQAVSQEVIKEIRKNWKTETTGMLVSSCWQSGLDYSEYPDDLVDVFLRSDYITAIECLTVIEESADELSRGKKDEIIKHIRESAQSPGDEISTLKLELISILEK